MHSPDTPLCEARLHRVAELQLAQNQHEQELEEKQTQVEALLQGEQVTSMEILAECRH